MVLQSIHLSSDSHLCGVVEFFQERRIEVADPEGEHFVLLDEFLQGAPQWQEVGDVLVVWRHAEKHRLYGLYPHITKSCNIIESRLSTKDSIKLKHSSTL